MSDFLKFVVVMVLICVVFALGVYAVGVFTADSDSNDLSTSVRSDNDGQIAGRYHRRSSTTRFFSRCRRG